MWIWSEDVSAGQRSLRFAMLSVLRDSIEYFEAAQPQRVDPIFE
jgi:hypothetical protein